MLQIAMPAVCWPNFLSEPQVFISERVLNGGEHGQHFFPVCRPDMKRFVLNQKHIALNLIHVMDINGLGAVHLQKTLSSFYLMQRIEYVSHGP